MGAVVAAILVGGMTGLALGKWGPHLKPRPYVFVDPIVPARNLSQQGKNLVREGKWIEAKATFVEALAMNPEYGGGTLQQYIARADKEIPVQLHLDAAEAALQSSELGIASHELDQCGDTQQQYERRDKLMALLDVKFESKLQAAHALLGSQADRSKMVELAAMAKDLLAVRPDHPEALELEQTADDALHRIDRQTHPAR